MYEHILVKYQGDEMEFLKALYDSGIGKILTSGAVVNFFTVIAGTLIGLLFKKGIPERVKTTLMNGMALSVMYIGITGIFEESINVLIIIASFAIGAVIGEIVDFDRLVNRLGTAIEAKLGGKNTKIADGFITSTLLFCVGAMTVVGSIDSGISGDNSTLYSKAVIDGIAAVALTSSMGIGVMLSALSVLILEGGITLLASIVTPVLTESAIAHMSVVGSLLIIALSLNMLEITKIKVMNYLPSIFLPLIILLVV